MIVKKRISNKKLHQAFQRLSAYTSRMKFAETLGQTYGGDRDLYQALGYTKELKYENYYQMYKRGDIAKVVINKPANAVWGNPPKISEQDQEVIDKDENSINNQWKKLVKKYNMYSQILRLDKLLGLGKFALLLFGFDDSTNFESPLKQEKNTELLYIQPYGENNVEILKYETDQNNPRYGLPVMYNIKIMNPNTNTKSSSMKVHYTRVLHVVEDPLENEVFGTPRLEALFNRLEDLQKLLGGSAEMFWRGARPGYAAKADADSGFGSIDADEMKDQFDEFENNLRRWLTVQGVDIKPLAPQVESPRDHIDAQIMMISIVTGIPKRILTGSERGELASTQDEKVWNSLIKDRMKTFAEPQILRPLLDKLIDCGILNTDKEDYVLTWPKMSAMGEKEKADITKMRSQAISEYLKTPGADMLIPPEIWLRDEFGYTEDQIKEIEDIIGSFDAILHEHDLEDEDELEEVTDIIENALKEIEKPKIIKKKKSKVNA